MEMTKKKMGGLGKLSQFSKIKIAAPVEDAPVAVKEAETEATVPSPDSLNTAGTRSARVKSEPLAEVEGAVKEEDSRSIGESVAKKTNLTNKEEKLVTVNIKITKSQKDWLADTASQVRENNMEPVPPAERVYPQHLIGVAIDLLRSADVDWNLVQNIEELREQLNL
jgi:hypothetical protein